MVEIGAINLRVKLVINEVSFSWAAKVTCTLTITFNKLQSQVTTNEYRFYYNASSGQLKLFIQPDIPL